MLDLKVGILIENGPIMALMMAVLASKMPVLALNLAILSSIWRARGYNIIYVIALAMFWKGQSPLKLVILGSKSGRPGLILAFKSRRKPVKVS